MTSPIIWVTGHSKWYHLKALVRFPIHIP